MQKLDVERYSGDDFEEFDSQEEEYDWYENEIEKIAKQEEARIRNDASKGIQLDLIDSILLRMAEKKRKKQ